MKILMEDVLSQFNEKKGINSYLEATEDDDTMPNKEDVDYERLDSGALGAWEAVETALQNAFSDSIEKTASSALKKFVTKYKLPEDALIEMIKDRINDVDKEDLSLADLFFLQLGNK